MMIAMMKTMKTMKTNKSATTSTTLSNSRRDKLLLVSYHRSHQKLSVFLYLEICICTHIFNKLYSYKSQLSSRRYIRKDGSNVKYSKHKVRKYNITASDMSFFQGAIMHYHTYGTSVMITIGSTSQRGL